MKSNYYEQLTGLLTPYIVSGQISKGDAASALAILDLAENEAYKQGFEAKNEEMHREDMQAEAEGIMRDEIYENVTING